MNIAATFVMTVKNGGKWTTVPAPESKLRNLKRGHFRLTYYSDGKRQSENVGRVADVALAALTRKRKELAYVSVGGKVEKQKVTDLKTAVADYLTDIKNSRGENTHSAYKQYLELFQQSCKIEHVERIDEADIKKFIRSLWQGREARTVYNIASGVNIFLRAHGSNVAKKEVKKLRQSYDEKVVEAYRPEELTAFFAACEPDEMLLFKFFLSSGCREQEVAHCEVRDINFSKNVLHVQPKPSRNWKLKDHEDRFVSLPAALVEKLKTHVTGRQPSDLLFPSKTGRVEGHYLRRLQRIVERAGLSGQWELHKWRKTFATTPRTQSHCDAPMDSSQR